MRLFVTDLTEWVLNELQNWEFRIEDVILHTLTGVLTGITIKIRTIIKFFKKKKKKV